VTEWSPCNPTLPVSVEKEEKEVQISCQVLVMILSKFCVTNDLRRVPVLGGSLDAVNRVAPVRHRERLLKYLRKC
jgi:hypothetical protein